MDVRGGQNIVETILALVGVNLTISNFTNTKYIDYAFAVGLIGSGSIWFFTSKGGITSSYTDSVSQVQTANFNMKKKSLVILQIFHFIQPLYTQLFLL